MEKNKKTILIMTSVAILTIFVAELLITSLFFNKNLTKVVSNTESEILTVSELALYLKISETELEDLVKSDRQKKIEMTSSGITSWDTYLFIPYLEVAGKKLFSKSEIDKWFHYQIHKN